MAKKESTLVNMLLTLFVITFVAAAALGVVYSFTMKPVAEAKVRKTVKAVEMVLPAFDNNPKTEMFKLPAGDGIPANGDGLYGDGDGLDSLEIYPATKEGKLIGVAVKTATKVGFSGEIKVMVGFDAEGKVHNTFVLMHKETPGLGTKLAEYPFKKIFEGLDLTNFNLKVKKDGGDVDAITAATISTRAFSDAVDRAARALENIDMSTGKLK